MCTHACCQATLGKKERALEKVKRQLFDPREELKQKDQQLATSKAFSLDLCTSE
jgi:hypothetical protein